MASISEQYNVKESLFTDVDAARELLDARSSEVDNNYIKPLKEAVTQVASQYPLSSLFLAIFLSLSILPIISFFGFLICSGSLIIAASLLFLIFWAGVIIGSACIILAGVLALAACIALGVTASAGAGTIAYRLLVNIKQEQDVRAGARVTISQVRTYLAPPKAKGQATTAAVSKQKEEDKEKKPSLTLPESPVIIDDKPIKSEEL